MYTCKECAKQCLQCKCMHPVGINRVMKIVHVPIMWTIMLLIISHLCQSYVVNRHKYLFALLNGHKFSLESLNAANIFARNQRRGRKDFSYMVDFLNILIGIKFVGCDRIWELSENWMPFP